MKKLLSVAIRYEHDVVLARQRARQIADLLGFEPRGQVQLATAVSEIARNAFQYARGGTAEFLIAGSNPARLEVHIKDQGQGIPNLKQILDGDYQSPTGLGMGIVGSRRLMDDFRIDSAPEQGTSVVLAKLVPRKAPSLTPERIAEIAMSLAMQTPRDPFGELQHQNQELLTTLSELEKRQTELAQLNKELEDTNRGVVALYAELDEKADYLRRASELKSQFLSNMTHEFRTPLNSILSLTRMLLDRVDGDLTVEQERQAKFIEKAANDLSDLVNDLLDLAKVEAGKVAVRPAEFEVKDLFAALRGMLRPLLQHNSSVSLQFDAPAGVPPLNTDESKISQVLRNLISNALKYTERGEIRVSARMEPDGRVAFSVRDTGIGIAAADQERIFEEFTQIEGPHQTGKRGTGLGLPLSRKLAGLLGGTLTVRSKPSVGSEFTFRIPAVYQDSNETAFLPDPPTEPDPARRPVLIIDDDEVARYVLRGLLADTRYRIIESDNGFEGLELARHHQPLAIFLDLMMPDRSGFEVLNKLKKDPATQSLPVIIHTGKVLTTEELRGLKKHAVAVIPKEHSNRAASIQKLREALVQAEAIRKRAKG